MPSIVECCRVVPVLALIPVLPDIPVMSVDAISLSFVKPLTFVSHRAQSESQSDKTSAVMLLYLMCFCILDSQSEFWPTIGSFSAFENFNRLSYFEPMRGHSRIGFSFNCSSFVVLSLLLKSGLKGKRLDSVQSLSRR